MKCLCLDLVLVVMPLVSIHGPLTRYVKLQVAHAPGMPRTFSPPPRVCDLGMHHGTCVTHVPWCMSGSQTSGFLWSRWRAKRSRHSRCMRNPQFYVSGKRPIARTLYWSSYCCSLFSVSFWILCWTSYWWQSCWCRSTRTRLCPRRSRRCGTMSPPPDALCSMEMG